MNRATAKSFVSSHIEAPAARVLTRLGFTANGLTLSGLLIAGAAAYLLGAGYLAVGGAAVLISGLFDMFDGAVARATGRATSFGALLDSVVDRVAEAVVLLGILVYFLGEGSTPGAVLAYVALAGSVMVSYVKARAEGLGIECEVGLLARPERVALLGVGLIAGQWWPTAVTVVLATIAALAIVTTVQRISHARRELSSRE